MELFTGGADRDEQVCCEYKRTLLRNYSLFNDVCIQPRIVRFNKYAKCKTYKETVQVTNKAMVFRKFTITSDCDKEIAYKILGSTDLQPEMSFAIDIYLEPVTKCSPNRRLHIFISAVHPNMTIEVPIFILSKNTDIIAPKSVTLPKTSPNVFSYYGLVLWNPLSSALEVKTSIGDESSQKQISVEPEVALIPTLCCTTLFIKGTSENFNPLVGTLNLRLSNRCSYVVSFKCEIASYYPFLHEHFLKFPLSQICSESKRSFSICNESLDVLEFEWRSEGVESNQEKSNECFQISPFFKLAPKKTTLPPNSSTDVQVTFCPTMDLNIPEEETTDPPYQLKSSAQLLNSKDEEIAIDFVMTGSTIGADFEFSKKEILLNDIYLGEQQIVEILVINNGPVCGTITYKGLKSCHDGFLEVAKRSVSLEPFQAQQVSLEYFGRQVGQFLDQAVFKVKFGRFLKLLIRGNCRPVKILTWPDALYLGDLPICITQKQFLMIANPLSVPIVVHSKVIEDGVDDPLVLDVNMKHLPVTVSKCLKGCESDQSTCISAKGSQYWMFESATPLASYHLRPLLQSDCMHDKYKSVIDDEIEDTSARFSETSLEYREGIDENLKNLATDLIRNVKTTKPHQWPEADLNVIHIILDELTSNPYFKPFHNVQNYKLMNWEDLSCNPQEVIIDRQPIYLKPHESKIFPILIIPNQIGLISKLIYFQCCPVGSKAKEMSERVCSDFMTTLLEVHYHCKYPCIQIVDSNRILDDIYVDKETSFEIRFRNESLFAGYVYFKVIPKTKEGRMQIEEGYEKFHIKAEETVVVPCTAVFLQTGPRVLSAAICVVGCQRPLLVKVGANVLPPKLTVSPCKINHTLHVLECVSHRIFIENVSWTRARFTIHLQNEKYQMCEPSGGILGPGQKILILIDSKFFDPGVYKNVFIIKTTHINDIKIPLTFRVQGIPIVFTPNIENGFNMGPLFVSKSLYTAEILAKNHGEKFYRINIAKKQGVPKSSLEFELYPNSVDLLANEERSFTMTLSSTREDFIETEFSVSGSFVNNRRFFLFRFIARAHFIRSSVKWSKDAIHFHISNTEEAQDKLCDIVKLRNSTPLPITVELKVIGDFVILEPLPLKTFNFQLSGCESKNLVLHFEDKLFSRQSTTTTAKGRISCRVFNKMQKGLSLTASMLYPVVKFVDPVKHFFTINTPFEDFFEVVNCGPLEANFKIQQIREEMFCPNLPEENVRNLHDDLSESSISEIFKRETFASNEMNDSFSEIKTQRSQQNTMASNVEGQKVEDVEQLPSLDDLTEPSLKYLERTDEEEDMDDDDFLSTATQQSTPLACGESKKAIYLDYSQTLEANCKQRVRFCFPKPQIGVSVRADYELSVLGGNTEKGTLIIYNFAGKVELSTDEFDFGKQPWYKAATRTLKMSNNNEMEFHIDILPNNNKEDNLMNGFIKILSTESFPLPPRDKASVRFRTYMGLSSNFCEELKIKVNKSSSQSISVNGQGLLPFITILNLQRDYKFRDRILEFEALNSLYESHIESRNLEEEQIVTQEEVNRLAMHLALCKRKRSAVRNMSVGSIASDNNVPSLIISNPDDIDELANTERRIKAGHILCITDEGTYIRNPHKKMSFKAKSIQEYDSSLCDFEVLDYPIDYVDVVTIDRTIETMTFLRYLNIFKETKRAFSALCMKYVKFKAEKAKKFPMPVNYRNFIVRPIPYQTAAYLLDFGSIVIEDVTSFTIELLFHGPGKAKLSARTLLDIPGFDAKFVGPAEDSSFLIYNTPFDILDHKKYLNIRDREMSAQNPDCRSCRLRDNPSCDLCDLKLCHAHSYDIDLKMVHQRQLDARARKLINKYYTRLNQRFKDLKDPFILSEIYQKEDEPETITNNLFIELELKFFPGLFGCYRSGQIFDDILFIDIHLGPTVPIIMRGKFSSKYDTPEKDPSDDYEQE